MNITNTSPDQWQFFAKGNANILFRYMGPNQSLKATLLRLRLNKDKETYVSTRDVKYFMDNIRKDLCLQEIVESELITVDLSFLQKLNTRGNELMLSESHGILLLDVLHGYDHHDLLSKHCTLHIKEQGSKVQSIVVELKPKWLYDNRQNYCRTCLLFQLKGKDRHFCPLDLLHFNAVPKGVSDLLSKTSQSSQTLLALGRIPISSILVEYFQSKANILLKLKQEQDNLDDGVRLSEITQESQVLDKLALRMTLRDVGVFLVICLSDNLQDVGQNNVIVDGFGTFRIQPYIYDLDLKSKSRYQHWVETEKKLQPVYNSTHPNWEYCVKS